MSEELLNYHFFYALTGCLGSVLNIIVVTSCARRYATNVEGGRSNLFFVTVIGGAVQTGVLLEQEAS